MAETKLPTEQITVYSSKTGEHNLDTYIEAAEKGGRTLSDLLDDIFDANGALRADVELRYSGPNIQWRYGIYADPEAGWANLLTFHQWKGVYTPAANYNTGDVVEYQNGIIYFIEDYTNVPAVPDPDTDPKLIWIIDDEFISQILAQMTTMRDTTQTNHDNVATMKTAIEGIQTDIQNRQATIVSLEQNCQDHRNATEGYQIDTLAYRNTTLGYRDEVQILRDETQVLHDNADAMTRTVTDQLIFKGLWDIATNGYPPTPDGMPEKNVYYRLTSTGYVGGEQVHNGYEMAYDYDNATWYVLGSTFDPDDYVPKTGGNFTSKIDFDAGIQTQSVKVNDFADSQNPQSFWQFHAWLDDFQITSRNADGSYKATNFEFSWTAPDEAKINGNRIYHKGYEDGLVTDSGSQYIDGPKTFWNGDITGSASTAPIRIRERNQVGAAQSSLTYAPGLAFYWNGHHTKQLQMDSAGDLLWEGQKLWRADNDGSGSGLDADTGDGVHASTFCRATNANGHYGLTTPTGSTNDWIRTTVNGIIPYQSGGASSLGTSAWPFTNIYGTNVYSGGNSVLTTKKTRLWSGGHYGYFNASSYLTNDNFYIIEVANTTTGSPHSFLIYINSDGISTYAHAFINEAEAFSLSLNVSKQLLYKKFVSGTDSTYYIRGIIRLG